MWKRRKYLICLVILYLWLIETVEGKVDICSSLCRCVNESHFVKIHCDFIDNKEYKLDERLTLPPLGNALNITLGDKSSLAIQDGFFNSINRMNSVVIQGKSEDFKNKQNHVLMLKNSLRNIGGNFPEISFKNLKSVYLSEQSLDTLLELNLIVEDVWHVVVERKVFGSTTVNASFNDIADLQLKDGILSTDSYNLTKPKMFINRSWITTLYPMRGKKLTELRIENSGIDTIKSSAFKILELPSLVLDNVTIRTIESDIFNEPIVLENLAVTNCKIDKIASNAIHDVGITKFTFEKNIINSIEENSMEFVGVEVNVAHNKINFMGQNWLKTHQWSKVAFFNNTFGSFDSVSLENPGVDSGLRCTLHHNSFTKVQPKSFRSINGQCTFSELMFKENCACNFDFYLKARFDTSLDIKKLRAESFCSLDTGDILYRCLKAEAVKYYQYYSEMCSKKKSTLKCDRVNVDKIDAKFIDPKVLTDDFDWMEYINYIIGACICILLVPCVCITIAVRRKTRNVGSDHYAHDTMNHQTDLQQLNQSEGPPSYEASLRSTKTFSNRDHIIIKRTLETMKQKQPDDKYELVYNNTKRLLHEHLNEYEKVRIIGDIVQTIGECENSGEDFVAFTDILYKHLAPDTTTAVRTTVPRQQQPLNDLYAEPNLPQNTRDPAKVNSEHIYAEPTVLMQQQTMIPLLLANNYSNPVDNNAAEAIINNNVYSEPIIHEQNIGTSSFKPLVATPYAISQTIDQQPSTSKNLPDILNRMEPGTSGELNRITRSPNSNRKIPEYTVPSTSHKAPQRITKDTIEDWSDESMEGSTSSNHSGGSNATVKIDELI